MGCCFHCAFWQTFQLTAVSDVQFEFICLLQMVLREFQCQRAQFCRQFSESLLVAVAQVGAVSDKSVVSLFKKSFFLVCKVQAVFLFIHLLDFFEQYRIQTDVIAVFRKFRHQSLGYGVQLVVCLGAHEVEKHGSNPVKQFARMFQRKNSVTEIRLVLTACYYAYLLVFSFHTLPDCRFVVGNTDFVEWGSVVRCIIWL